jgi:TatA/E family protein of Tat protein translocase
MEDSFNGPHIILITLVVLLLFGGKKIPELMREMGKHQNEVANRQYQKTLETLRKKNERRLSLGTYYLAFGTFGLAIMEVLTHWKELKAFFS